MLILFITSCTAQPSSTMQTNSIPSNVGNLMGNLYNMGIMVQDDCFIYYVVIKERKPFLYKTSLDCTRTEIIYQGYPTYLNLLDNYIYFIDSDNGGSICKMDINGQEKITLYQPQVTCLYLYEDRLFFFNIDDKSLYSMDISGENQTKISQDIISAGPCFYENKLYYTTQNEESNSTVMYQMELDGNNKVSLFEEDYIYSFFIYNNGFVILTPLGIYKMDLHGDNKEQEVKSESVFRTSLNICENYLYYRDLGTRNFYRVNLENGKSEVIAKEKIQCTHILCDRIFYMTDKDEYIMMDMDGKNRKVFFPHKK